MRWRRRTEQRRRSVDAEAAIGAPYLALAREIHDEVARVASDPSAHVDLLTELIDRIPDDKRMDLARAVFDRLPATEQWAIVERVFGDEDVRAYLEGERAEARARAERLDVARTARAAKRLDTRTVPSSAELTLGLFRDHDVRAALARGHRSSTCARRLVLRAVGDGRFQVIEDVFNPNGGYFVTAEYSADTWRERDRLDGHAIVAVGSISGDADDPDGGVFAPVLYPAGRVDFEIGGRATPGLLQLGFAMVDDVDIFVP